MTPAGGAPPRALGADRLELGEGARWIDGALYLVDLLAGRLLTLEDGRSPRLRPVLSVPQSLGAVAPLAGRPGWWMAATGTGIAVVDPTGGCEWLDRPEDTNPVPVRMNDGTVDTAGRFWAGSMASDDTPCAGSLFRVDHDGSVRRVLDGISVANGPAFAAAGDVMYLADSSAGTIDRYAVDIASGNLTGREPFIRINEPGCSPDGMTVDTEGGLWVAIWGGSQVRRYRPDGSLDQTISLPASQPTSVCLGGPHGSRLFVTTASVGLRSPGGLDGALFMVEADVVGVSLAAVILR